jgi:pimeloyl-ACP methyl ester carboxylesterase
VRKLPAVIAALGLVAVALVGCSTGAPSCTRVADSDPDVTSLIKVSGSTESKPDISVSTPFNVDKTAWADVATGSGTPITTKKQLVVLDVSLSGGDNGKSLVSTAYSGDLTSVFSVSKWNQAVPGIATALQCATAGTRVKVAIPGSAIPAATAEGLGLDKGESAVAVVDVRKVYLSRATGTFVYNSGFNLPSVVRAPDGRPGVIVPDGTAPSKLVIQTLIKGAGPTVTGEDPVRLDYTTVNWSTKSVGTTTWSGDPESVTLSSMPKGFQDAVKGATVGSQIMAVIPKSQLGSGASDTLIFVIDILGIDAPGTSSSQ